MFAVRQSIDVPDHCSDNLLRYLASMTARLLPNAERRASHMSPQLQHVCLKDILPGGRLNFLTARVSRSTQLSVA